MCKRTAQSLVVGKEPLIPCKAWWIAVCIPPWGAHSPDLGGVLPPSGSPRSLSGGYLASEVFQGFPQTTDLPGEAVVLSSDQRLGTPHSDLVANADAFRGQGSMSEGQVARVGLKACSEGGDFIHCPLDPSTWSRVCTP